MSINSEQSRNLLEDEYPNNHINNDNNNVINDIYNIIEQKTKINLIKKLTIANIVISAVLLLIIIFMTIEYNIILHNFNGFQGMENFINNTTILVNNLTPIINKINQTEAHIYLEKVMFLIDYACNTMKCPNLIL